MWQAQSQTPMACCSSSSLHIEVDTSRLRKVFARPQSLPTRRTTSRPYTAPQDHARFEDIRLDSAVDIKLDIGLDIGLGRVRWPRKRRRKQRVWTAGIGIRPAAS